MNKHTPGPWAIQINADADESSRHLWSEIVRLAPSGVHAETGICRVHGWGFSYDRDEEQQANARLIAAAPDLLAALEHMVDILLGGDPIEQSEPWCQEICATARAAIAKARGE